MKAIIYTSNAGSTVQYAQLLADELHLPVYSAKEAKKKVPVQEGYTTNNPHTILISHLLSICNIPIIRAFATAINDNDIRPLSHGRLYTNSR